MTRTVSFEQAKAQFVNRYTMEHVPVWAKKPVFGGMYPAPQYRTDWEWYENTFFHGESELTSKKYCHSYGETWPLGKFLKQPFKEA